MQEGVLLFGSDDINDVFVEPLLILGIKFPFEILVLSLLLFGRFFIGLLLIPSRGLLLLRVGNTGEGQPSQDRSEKAHLGERKAHSHSFAPIKLKSYPWPAVQVNHSLVEPNRHPTQ